MNNTAFVIGIKRITKIFNRCGGTVSDGVQRNVDQGFVRDRLGSPFVKEMDGQSLPGDKSAHRWWCVDLIVHGSKDADRLQLKFINPALSSSSSSSEHTKNQKKRTSHKRNNDRK